MIRLLLSFFGICLAMICVMAAPLQAVPTETTIREMAPGVYFRKAQTEPVFTGCNQGWVVFKDYVLVIDANFPGQAEEVIPTIRKYTDKPIRFVFDTHYHGDHADGNMQYAKIGATVIAHERSQPLFQTKGLEAFTRAKQDKSDEYGKLSYEIPSLYFSHKLIFDDGEQRVELIFLGHAHTAGDAVAWLPKHGLLFTGDACVNGAFNYTGDSNTESWIATLGAMQELPVKHLAPGHGELGGPEILANQKRYFLELRQSVREQVDQGKSLDEIKKGVNIPFYKEWTGVEAATRTENIEHVHKELTAGKQPLSEDKKFGRWLKRPGSGGYANLGVWDKVGECDADRRWDALADLYLDADSVRRKQIRDYFQGKDGELRDMWWYIRRNGQRIRSQDDVVCLRRGLAIAAIEGGRWDYHDTIVSLVLLRHGAERVGIDHHPFYQQIQDCVATENRPLFENARTHSAQAIAATIAAFGPEGWR